MDLNFGHAGLVHYFGTRHRHDQLPFHLERKMVVYKPARSRAYRSWTTAMRRWTGAGLIFLGERIGQQSAPEAVDVA